MGGLLALSSGIDRINSMIGRAVSWLILIAVLVSAGNAIIRKMYNISSNAWLELQWYLYGGAFLLAAAYTLKENEHIRIDILYGRWSRRTQHWIDLIGHTLFLAPFVIVSLYFIIPWFQRSYNYKEMSMNSGGLMLWPAKVLLLTGFILLLAQAISEIIKKIAVMRGVIDDPTPFVSHHEAALAEGEAMAAEMADPNHPAADLNIDKPLHDPQGDLRK
ncbi:MAG: TRAP transporter small permease subunit [Paracoccus sp. (in: a-proteobacteria)]|nr:TRAP transporter small permease subunit [Paracoccus sp. (in: a-proteobacteria)]